LGLPGTEDEDDDEEEDEIERVAPGGECAYSVKSAKCTIKEPGAGGPKQEGTKWTEILSSAFSVCSC
jgi:hypothetical protein